MPTSVNILAAVLSPVLLWTGAAAVSVPILIHFLTRRRFRRVRWAAIEFLLEANRQNRRRVRIEELILLALRCLAMLLAGVMLARVFVQPEALAAMLGAKARTERIVVLDDSFSMGLNTRNEGRGARNEGPGTKYQGRRTKDKESNNGATPTAAREATVFGQAKAAVERLAGWLREESPDDSLTIVLTSRPDRPLRVEPAVGKMDPNAFAAELEGLAPSCRGGNMPATLESVRQFLENRQGQVNAAVYVISDFQRVDWAASEDAGRGSEISENQNLRDPTSEEVGHPSPGERPARRPAATELQKSPTKPPRSPTGLPRSPTESPESLTGKNPVAALAGWAGRGRSLRVVLVDIGVEATQNLCVTAIEPQQAQALAGVSARYAARVTNFGQADAPAGLMRVFVGDAAQPRVAVPPVPAGESIEVPVEVAFPNEGVAAVTVELDPDPLPVDNSRTLSVPVARALRVLLVDGEAAADPYQDETFLLSVAIRPEGPQFSGNEVTVVDENELETADLSAYHVVMLANVYRLTEEAATRLEHFAAAGGGVAVFLGDQVDPEIYNRVLYRDGQGLLPAQLGEVISAPADRPGFGFGEIDGAQPLMRRFTDPQAGLFRGVTAWRFIAAEPATIGAATAPAGTATKPAAGAASPAGAPAHVLARFDDPNKHPALIERPFGQGRVLLLTTTIDKEWTDLPDRPLFVLLALEMVQHLAKPSARGGEQLVGEPIKLKLEPARYRPVATLKPPRYPDEPAVRIDVLPDADTGLPSIYWPQTAAPGLYRFELIDTAGGETVEEVAVNVDPRESDLRRASGAKLLESMSGLAGSSDGSPGSAGGSAGSSQISNLRFQYVAGDDLLRQRDDQARRELWPGILIALVVVLMIEQALAVWFGSDRDWRAMLRGRRP